MPNRNHKESRILFIREAKKLYQKEFIRWCKLTAGINKILKVHRSNDIKIPSVYVMGKEDHLFLPSIKQAVTSYTNAILHVIENAGHVANVDQPIEFNSTVIKFIKSQ